MQQIPLQVLPNQTLQCTLNGQACTINVYQQAYGLYVDLFVSGQVIVQGIIALDRNLIVRNAYFGFIGDIGFMDTQSNNDPVYTAFGTRFVLLYLTPADVAGLNLSSGAT